MNKTLEEHNKEQREEFEKKFIPQDILIEDFGNAIGKRDEKMWKFIETQNKALLKKEKERVGKVIEGIERTGSILEEVRNGVSHPETYNQALKDLKQALCK